MGAVAVTTVNSGHDGNSGQPPQGDDANKNGGAATSPSSTTPPPSGKAADELRFPVRCWACEKNVKHRLWQCPENKPANTQRILENFRKSWGKTYSHPPANTLQVPASPDDLNALRNRGTKREPKQGN